MKKVIRNCVFETNSSASHSIVILSVDDEKRWEEDGDLYAVQEIWTFPWEKAQVKPDRTRLYSKKEIIKLLKDAGEEFDENDEDVVEEIIMDNGFMTYGQWEAIELECDGNEFTTPSGDHMIAMCHYGYEY